MNQSEQEKQKKKHAWLAVRKEAARKIDPETAEVMWDYGDPGDPYGIYPELPEEAKCVGRNYFARSPGSDVWVSFYDLPRAVSDALWKKHRTKLAFPASLPQVSNDDSVIHKNDDGTVTVHLTESEMQEAVEFVLQKAMQSESAQLTFDEHAASINAEAEEIRRETESKT